MKRADVKLNGVYLAKVSGRLVSVRVDRINEVYRGDRVVIQYACKNLATDRNLIIRSAARFRGPGISKTPGTGVSTDVFEQAFRDMPDCVGPDPLAMKTLDDLRWACQLQLDLIDEGQDGTEDDDSRDIRRWLKKYGTLSRTC